ncbi:P-loop containing nucleoside triphosphatehydrolases superfamily protein [Striga asiatica]|uniref:P-loop containing nucleoside triphosphatehydrolases superfamily protein n=1 Tax=Striga asiatica TaxID=4170 RepID=A0A5A7NZV3_STRAF|nr:P-loop containing nucleoside triphosphatehydrolases superfamily protein [Striga asiatica]
MTRDWDKEQIRPIRIIHCEVTLPEILKNVSFAGVFSDGKRRLPRHHSGLGTVRGDGVAEGDDWREGECRGLRGRVSEKRASESAYCGGRRAGGCRPRKPRKFNPIVIPKSLQEALPFASKPKDIPSRKRASLENRRAVVMEPHDRKRKTQGSCKEEGKIFDAETNNDDDDDDDDDRDEDSDDDDDDKDDVSPTDGNKSGAKNGSGEENGEAEDDEQEEPNEDEDDDDNEDDDDDDDSGEDDDDDDEEEEEDEEEEAIQPPKKRKKRRWLRLFHCRDRAGGCRPRKPRKFNPIVIPKSLQKALPFASKLKEIPSRKRTLLENRRAVVMEPHDRKVHAMVQQAKTQGSCKEEGTRSGTCKGGSNFEKEAER